MVNKFFYIKGGSETYYFALKRLLESKGHEVIDFSMKDEKNFESPYSDYFVEAVDYNGPNGFKEKIRAARNILEIRKNMETEIQELHTGVRGTLRLGVPVQRGMEIVPFFLPKLKKKISRPSWMI